MDHIVILHAADGVDIAEFIRSKLSDDKYRCEVTLFDISEEDCCLPPNVKVSILLKTPEVEDHIRNMTRSDHFSKLFPSPRHCVLLRHVTAGTNSDTEDLLNALLKGFNKWTVIDLGISIDDYKKTLLQIMELVDKPPGLRQVDTFPKSIDQTSVDVCVVFKKEVPGEVTIWIKEDKTELKTKRLNPFTCSFKSKGLSPGKKTLELYEDNYYVGTSTLEVCSKMKKLEVLLKSVDSPMESLCQVLRVDNTADLDLELCDILANENQGLVNLDLSTISSTVTVNKSENELPTILHFAAMFGLFGFCQKLLECPGAALALKMKNKYEQTPRDIARLEGFKDLANLLTPKEFDGQEDTYMNMSSPPQSPALMSDDNINLRVSQSSSVSSEASDSGFFPDVPGGTGRWSLDRRQMSKRMTMIWNDNSWELPLPPRLPPRRTEDYKPTNNSEYCDMTSANLYETPRTVNNQSSASSTTPKVQTHSIATKL